MLSTFYASCFRKSELSILAKLNISYRVICNSRLQLSSNVWQHVPFALVNFAWTIAEIRQFLTLIIPSTYPEIAFMSTSGQDGLRRQNIRGGRSLDPPLRRKEPTRLGDVAPLPVAGCTVSPGEEVHSRVRLRAERECVCDDVTVPGGGTTWKHKQIIEWFR